MKYHPPLQLHKVMRLIIDADTRLKLEKNKIELKGLTDVTVALALAVPLH